MAAYKTFKTREDTAHQGDYCDDYQEEISKDQSVLLDSVLVKPTEPNQTSQSSGNVGSSTILSLIGHIPCSGCDRD